MSGNANPIAKKLKAYSRAVVVSNATVAAMANERRLHEPQVTVRHSDWLHPDDPGDGRWLRQFEMSDGLVRLFGLRTAWAFIIREQDDPYFRVAWNAGEWPTRPQDEVAIVFNDDAWHTATAILAEHPVRTFLAITESFGPAAEDVA